MPLVDVQTRQRRRVVVDDRPLALSIGARLRVARKRAGLTQQALAGDRYTKAYISALETGVAKPSMAALNYLSGRLGMPASSFISDTETAWTRLEADLRLAQGDFAGAARATATSSPPSRTARRARGLLVGCAEALVPARSGRGSGEAGIGSDRIFEDSIVPRTGSMPSTGWRRATIGADNDEEARA